MDHMIDEVQDSLNKLRHEISKHVRFIDAVRDHITNGVNNQAIVLAIEEELDNLGL